MTALRSFLPTSDDVLRTMLQGIMESYDNPWDILAELSQNALDAIHKEEPTKGHLHLKLDAKRAKITFRDNGTGIPPDQLEDLFVPYGTNKRNDPDSIGEKGVGLKFVIFSTNNFKLTSHHRDGSFQVTVKRAADWLRGEDVKIGFTPKEIDNSEDRRGVKVELSLANDKHELFGLGIDQLQALLLTKTAVGSTAHVWGDEPENADIAVRIIDASGKETAREFECQYMLPTDGLRKTFSVNEYNDWKAERERNDNAKQSKFKDAVIYNQGAIERAGREIRYWSCMAPSRKQWAKNAVSSGLISAEDRDDFNTEEHYFAHHSGVYLSTKNMPTGVAIDLRPTGVAGYAHNFFMLIEDRRLTFDIGRTGIPSRTKGLLRQIAQNEFKRYLQYSRFFRGEGEKKHNTVFERERLFESIRALSDLRSEKSLFVKRPKEQEATVAAMFYEQMGQKAFVGFEPYISGYRDRYDLTGRYNGRNLVIEFKNNLSGLFADYSEARKLFDEMNVVVLWRIEEKDRQKAKDRYIEIEDIEDDEERLFPGTQHKLVMDSVSPVEVLVLSKWLSVE